MATSEAYNSKAVAMGGIRSVQKLAGEAAVEDQTTKEWSAREAARKAAAKANKTSAATKAKLSKKSSASKAR
ncbi:MAG: YegP family protein [Actinomycetota bacterium]|nr:YegP family protein [Actinomycetota bacterium]